MNYKKKIISILNDIGKKQGISVLVVLLIIAVIGVPNFTNKINLINVIRQGSLIFSFSIGMTLAMLLGGLNLSIGAVGALSAVYAASQIKLGNIFLGCLIGLGIGLIAGVITGFIIAKFKMPPFIMTYGMMQIGYGLTLNYTQGQSIYGFPDSFRWVGIGFLGSIPVPVLIILIILGIFFFIMRKTVWGRSIYAVGSNKDASRFSALPVDNIIISTYAIGGVVSAFAGLIYIARLGSAEGVMGQNWALQAIAASVLGGTTFNGGEGSIMQTFFGALSVAVIYNILNLTGVSSSWQKLAIGLIIILSVSFNYIRNKLVEKNELNKKKQSIV